MFSRSRRAYQTDNGTGALLCKAAHSQILQNTLLYLFQAVMVFIKHFLGMKDIIIIF